MNLEEQIKELQTRVTRLEHLIQNIQRVTEPMQVLGGVTPTMDYRDFDGNKNQ